MEYIQDPQKLVYDPSVGAMVPQAACAVYLCWDYTGDDACGVRICLSKFCGVVM